MKQKVTITFHEEMPIIFYGRPVKSGQTITLTANCTVTTEPKEHFADVLLLDARGSSPDREGGPTAGPWTFRNPYQFEVGTYVFVPFGPYNSLLLGKVVHTGNEPTYKGNLPIKTIEGEAVCE